MRAAPSSPARLAAAGTVPPSVDIICICSASRQSYSDYCTRTCKKRTIQDLVVRRDLVLQHCMAAFGWSFKSWQAAAINMYSPSTQKSVQTGPLQQLSLSMHLSHLAHMPNGGQGHRGQVFSCLFQKGFNFSSHLCNTVTPNRWS